MAIRLGGLLTGPLLCLALPDLSASPLAFVALIPLLLAVRGLSWGKRFLLGLGAGFLHYLGSLYSIAHLLQSMSEMEPIGAWALTSGLCLYHALFWGFFALGVEPFRALAPRFSWLTVPTLLVALELVFPQLFPWYLGSAAVPLLPISQVLDLVGVHGLGWLLASLQVLLAEAAATGWRERRLRPWPLLAAGAGAAAVLAYGYLRLADVRSAPPGETLRFAIVQPNFGATERRSADGETMSRLGRSVLAQLGSLRPGDQDLVFLPEGAFPFPYLLREKPIPEEEQLPTRRFAAAFAAEARRLGAHLIFGTPLFTAPEARPRNSLLHLDPQGAVVGEYDKVRLILFGERLPFDWMRGLLPRFEDLEPGRERRPFEVAGHRLAPTICYEAVFAGDVRDALDAGAGVLLNATNDVWFGTESNAAALHLLVQRARAIENRVPLLRAANTGISAVVLPDGTVLRQTAPREATIVQGQVASPKLWSLYRSLGDWWFVLPGTATLALLALGWRRRRPRNEPAPSKRPVSRGRPGRHGR